MSHDAPRMPPAMRLKTRWFRAGAAHGPEQQAQAVAFNVWRLALQALRRMRGADFDIDAGSAYFAFLREWLAYLAVVADRLAHARLDAGARAAFTVTLVRHVAATLQDNQHELLGPPAAGEPGAADRFIELFNALVEPYAEFDGEAGEAAFTPDYPMRRFLASRLEPLLPDKDRPWVLDQVLSIEAPQAVEALQRVFAELHDATPRRERRGAVTGE